MFITIATCEYSSYIYKSKWSLWFLSTVQVKSKLLFFFFEHQFCSQSFSKPTSLLIFLCVCLSHNIGSLPSVAMHIKGLRVSSSWILYHYVLIPILQNTRRGCIFQVGNQNCKRLIPGGASNKERIPKVVPLIVMEVH